MNKAIILDRDGTLNHDDGYTYKTKDFRLLPNVVDALKLLKDEFIFLIVTNQSGIGRGYYTEKDFLRFNSHLIKELRKKDIKIEKTYMCPHAPEDRCDCRKPSEKFLRQAGKEYNIDFEKSYVIGDHDFDIGMGQEVGCKKIFVLTGHGKNHVNELKTKPDFIAEDLLEAAKWILNNQ